MGRRRGRNYSIIEEEKCLFFLFVINSIFYVLKFKKNTDEILNII